MDELKKEIQILKRKSMYLWIIVICFVINSVFLYFDLLRGQTVIRDYYYESLDSTRDVYQDIQDQNESIEELYSSFQEFLSQYEKYFN